MKSWRENPECEENQRATKQHNREVFALKMQAKHEHENQDQTDDTGDVVPTDAQEKP